MQKSTAFKALRLSLAFTMPMLGAPALLMPTTASAATLPSPYVSRALDAVLIPVNADTIKAFGLGANDKGVLVLSTQPGGTADKAGILPGDVISTVHGKPVKDPISLDEIVYYWLTKDAYDFAFDGWRAGSAHSSSATVTMVSWAEVIEISAIASWTAYSYESFSYSEFYSEYSEEMTTSYEESTISIEATATSEEFTSEMTTEEQIDSVDETAPVDEAMPDDAVPDEGAAPDEGTADDQPAADEQADAPADEEPQAEEPADDEAQAEEPADDDGGASDGGDSGGDEPAEE